MMAKEIKVEIPAWVLIELIHKPQGELFKYNVNGQNYCVSRSPV